MSTRTAATHPAERDGEPAGTRTVNGLDLQHEVDAAMVEMARDRTLDAVEIQVELAGGYVGRYSVNRAGIVQRVS